MVSTGARAVHKKHLALPARRPAVHKGGAIIMKPFRFISVFAAMVAVSLIAAPGASAAKKSGAVAAKRYHATQIVDRDVVLRGAPRGGQAGRLIVLPTADNERQVLVPNPDGRRQARIPNPENGDNGRQVLTPNPDGQ